MNEDMRTALFTVLHELEERGGGTPSAYLAGQINVLYQVLYRCHMYKEYERWVNNG